MAKESSVAPKERVNIVYKPAIGDAKEEVELPLKLVMLGDYTLRDDDTPLEDRKVISVNKDNFNEVIRGQKLNVTFSVGNKLADDGGEIPVNLKFDSLKDFEPENIARQVPELQKLLAVREALTTLKGPLGNVPGFRKRLQAIIGDASAREQLLKELNLGDDGKEEKPAE